MCIHKKYIILIKHFRIYIMVSYYTYIFQLAFFNLFHFESFCIDIHSSSVFIFTAVVLHFLIYSELFILSLLWMDTNFFPTFYNYKTILTNFISNILVVILPLKNIYAWCDHYLFSSLKQCQHLQRL